jgi:hypothetical protein
MCLGTTREGTWEKSGETWEQRCSSSYKKLLQYIKIGYFMTWSRRERSLYDLDLLLWLSIIFHAKLLRRYKWLTSTSFSGEFFNEAH